MSAMRILEAWSDGIHDPNEDLLGWSGSFAWAIDGASGLGRSPIGLGTARYVAALDAALRDSVHDAVDALDLLRRGWQRSTDSSAVDAPGDQLPSASIAVVHVDDAGVQLDAAILGDVTVALPGVTWVDARIERFDQAVIDEIAGLLERGASFTDARASVQEQLRANRRMLNTPDGYWALSPDATRDPVEHAVQHHMDIAEALPFVVATDGFARAVDPFGIATWDAVLETGPDHRLQRLGDRLRDREQASGSMRRVPRLSVHDDASAIFGRVGGAPG